MSNIIYMGIIKTAPFYLKIAEAFYAITMSRNFPHPGLSTILNPNRGDIPS